VVAKHGDLASLFAKASEVAKAIRDALVIVEHGDAERRHVSERRRVDAVGYV
jgi:hypothetical protein